MTRVRLFEYGPSVPGGRGGGGGPTQVTTSDIRQSIRNTGTTRIKNPRNATTRQSVVRRKEIRGITPPGLQPYNYPESSLRNG